MQLQLISGAWITSMVASGCMWLQTLFLQIFSKIWYFLQNLKRYSIFAKKILDLGIYKKTSILYFHTKMVYSEKQLK